ncbi:penicillin acylase family protein [Roseateles toxinivorans]|uniref:Penicillin amidase n=1 Tax=Roseateles toxinivorans TaxID=270368 RepID=A0A4R6QKN0_9BURK|nr:penicillin acylase family protein [Roseateles toxinivorans]TDP64316.1 penicillin amidase [Roseateles toxinivorans]
MRWLRRLAVVVLVLLLCLALAFWLYSRQVLPMTEGVLTVSGLKAPLTIARDAHGIPSIKADSMEDLVFGLGFVHAQDRLWQLQTHKRIGSGRLAEAFGEAALESDRFLRALGVRRAAAAQWALASPESKALLTAYAAGVNRYVRSHLGARPPEFLILGLQPEDWEPVDSLAWSIMMAWDLGGNWTTELQRMRLALKLPVERINELIPPYPGEKALATADYAALYRDLKIDGELGQQALNSAPPSGIEGVGSNNWVVHGSHTVSGKPLLANDPHLKLSAPALWYFARLEAPGFKLAGATLPGLPLVVLGQNQHIAWGYTNTAPDVQDLYLERIKPDDASQYQTPNGWAAFTTLTETIKVKGKPDVQMTLRSTRHGPVISDAGVTEGLLGPKGKPSYALAMRWVALEPEFDAVAAGLAMSRANSVQDYVKASAAWLAPMQNMAVADRDGHIGMVAAGKVPIRKPEHDLKGLVPAPGWDARYDWAGFIPAAETPREIDPPRGWIATANQRIHGPDYPHYLTSEWAAPYRQQRIEQLLQATARHDLASLRAIQADQLSLGTLKLLPYLQKAKSNHPLAAAAQAQLQGFDGVLGADHVAPTLLWAWSRQLTLGLFTERVGGDAAMQKLLGARSFRDALELVLERNDTWWCKTDCPSQIDAAFTRALDELQGRLGGDVANWRWGRVHLARSEHRPFSRVKPLAGWFETRVAVGGDAFSVNVSRVSQRPDPTTGELYLDEHGPSLRALYDLGDLRRSRFVHSTGQSGLPFSPHYRDFVATWAKVEDVPLWGDGQPGRVLSLQPAP